MRTSMLVLLVVLPGCGARTGLASLEDAPTVADTPDAPACVPTGEERCNHADDDCDGAIDESLGFGPLSEPRVIRSDELTGGTCTSCRWAWDPVLSPVPDGYVAYFHVGIEGGSELDNVVRRRLDRDGAPVGPLEVLPDRVLLSFEPLARAPRPTVLATSIRSRTPPIDDVGVARIDSGGALTVIRSAFPIPGPGVPLALLDGRLVSVTTRDRAMLVVGSQSLEGTDPRTREIPFDEVLTAFVGHNDREIGIVVLTFVDMIHALHFVAVDARGEIVSPPVPLPLAYRAYPRLVGTSSGFLVIAPGDFDEPTASVARIDDRGSVVSDFRPLPELAGRLSSDLQAAIIHHPTAPRILLVHQDPFDAPAAEMEVAWLDETFGLLSSWRGPAPGFVVSPDAIVTGDGRVLVTWHGIAADREPNTVYVRPFGCVE